MACARLADRKTSQWLLHALVQRQAEADEIDFTVEDMMHDLKDLDGTSFMALVIAEIAEAWASFGKTSFYDKGPSEVMDIADIADPLMALPFAEAATLLTEIYSLDDSKYNEHGLVLWFDALDEYLAEEATEDWYDAFNGEMTEP
jgi:hypothetical protein